MAIYHHPSKQECQEVMFGSLQSYLTIDASPVFQADFIAQRPITSSGNTGPVLIYLPLKYKNQSIQK